jgi:hypothetical protein
MRFMLCGQEMRLVQTVPDETMIVPGFEHHTFHCSSCQDEERRLVFVRESKPLSPPIQTVSAPIQTREIGRDFLDATLQPVGEAAPVDGTPQESRTVKSEETLPAQRLPLASPTYRFSISRNPLAASSSVLGRAAALHRARWRALCDRVAGEKAGVSKEK